MPQEPESAREFSQVAEALIRMARELRERAGHPEQCVGHWLLALLLRHGPLVAAFVPDLDSQGLVAALQTRLSRGAAGEALDENRVREEAAAQARTRGAARVTEGDLAAVILPASHALLDELDLASVYRPRPTRPTPTLDRLGRDLTRSALEEKLPPMVGRDDEVQLVIETLCRRVKRNPVLVGPAGVGKTAIVEGLARRIVEGAVPELLRGARLVAVQPSSLLTGVQVVSEFHERIQALLAEAGQEGILLFIDEVHSIIGAGGRPGADDVASLLKPALARGEIACIAATTDEEYRRFIEADGALERRFQPVRIQELTPEETLLVLQSHRNELEGDRGVRVGEDVLRWLVDFAGRYLRNRHFPDKAVDLLEQCVAYALTQEKSAVDRRLAETVAQRLVGMPLAPEERLAALESRLAAGGVLSGEETAALINRLQVTLRGLDVQSTRPNAVVLLLGPAAEQSGALAEVIAQALFGAADRVVTIGCSRFTSEHDVSMMIGAPPGYVGYSDTLAFHQVLQMPWCVLRLENVHACHPSVRALLFEALREGVLTESRGRRIYLSDTVVLLTAEFEPERKGVLGFHLADHAREEEGWTVLEAALGPNLRELVDLVCSRAAASADARRRWLEQNLLASVSGRYRREGLELNWDGSVIEWLLGQKGVGTDLKAYERLIDNVISPLLIRHLPRDAAVPRTLTIRFGGSGVLVERQGTGGESSPPAGGD